MPKKITKITPKQAAKFGEWAEQWIRIGLSTEAADFDKATEAALRGYAAANLKHPLIILRMSSPYGAAIGGVIAWAMLCEIKKSGSQVWSQVRSQVWSQVGSQVGSQVWSQVGSQVRSQVWSQVGSQVGSQVWSQVGSQVGSQVWSQVRSQVWSQVGSQVRSQVGSQVESQVWSQVGSQVRSQVGSQVRSQVESQVGSQVRSQVWSQVGSQVGSQVESQVGSQVWSQVGSQVYYNSYHGSFWASWGAYVSFMRDVLQWDSPVLQKFSIEEDLIKNCGWAWWHENVLAISDRPIFINRDERGRLHCEVGPSIAYRDGWSLWHIHGVAVSQEIIERPELITMEKINIETNAEVRRVMIDRYKLGEEVCGAIAYLRDAGAKIIDHDELWGTLYRRDVAGDEPIVMVEVVNRTAEPDGSFRHYFLRVDPECRPLYEDGTKGSPQVLTAHAAVASTFGKRAQEYHPDFES